ncbi:MAG: rod-binding protein [Planctomycetales bacterium]
MSLSVSSITPAKSLAAPQSIKLTSAQPGISLNAAQAANGIALDTPQGPKPTEVKEKFQDFIAGTFFKQMLKAMRSSQKKPAYFHGGEAEETFQAQMDDIMSQNLAKSHGGAIADPLFKVYQQQRAGTLSSLDTTA